jgi:hypothetical protein
MPRNAMSRRGHDRTHAVQQTTAPVATDLLDHLRRRGRAAAASDGQLGRPPECPIELDPSSYSLGFRQGRASRAGMRSNAPQLRYPLLSIDVRLRRGAEATAQSIYLFERPKPQSHLFLALQSPRHLSRLPHPERAGCRAARVGGTLRSRFTSSAAARDMLVVNHGLTRERQHPGRVGSVAP